MHDLLGQAHGLPPEPKTRREADAFSNREPGMKKIRE
jgi:hypothetical protein